MSQTATTKDERFLAKLYELALAAGDPMLAIDRYVIGKAIGQNDRGINAITRLLAQANFIKKGEGNSFFLTAHGIALAKKLLNSYS